MALQRNTESSSNSSTSERVNESFVYKLSLKDYILRMLILGTRNNVYDHRKGKLSAADIEYINTQLKEGHGEEICGIVAQVYEDGRAPKQDNTLHILAAICRAENIDVRYMGLALIKKLRTISHLYSWKNFHADINNPDYNIKTKGFGRATKRHINEWILSYCPRAKELAYQITKYMTREGWSFKNILQCTHVKTQTGDDRALITHKSRYTNKNTGRGKKHDKAPTEIDLVLRYAVNGYEEMKTLAEKTQLNQIKNGVYEYLTAIHTAKHCTNEQKRELIDLIYIHKLAREQVPTWALADTDVLRALLVNKNKTRVTMPLTALIRNLGLMESHQVFADESVLELVITHLLEADTIKFSRIHPVTVLMAWFIYRKGRGNKGSATWQPNTRLVKTLEEMFYLSFKNVEPTGKRICFLIDGSGSMTSESLCEGVNNAEAAALLAMIFARSETKSSALPDHSFYIFTSNKNYSYSIKSQYLENNNRVGLTEVTDRIDAQAPLEQVLEAVQRSDWAQTDISIGILDALRYKRKYDAFVVITDNDVNSGIKPSEAMKQYRQGMKMPNVKLAVIATQGTNITIAEPADPNMMDMCGFDSYGPKILQDFIRS